MRGNINDKGRQVIDLYPKGFKYLYRRGIVRRDFMVIVLVYASIGFFSPGWAATKVKSGKRVSKGSITSSAMLSEN